MSRTRAISNISYRRTGVPRRLHPWRRRLTPFLPNAWRRPGRRIENDDPVEALVWPQRLHYRKAAVRISESVKIPSWPTGYSPATENACGYGDRVETELR